MYRLRINIPIGTTTDGIRDPRTEADGGRTRRKVVRESLDGVNIEMNQDAQCYKATNLWHRFYEGFLNGEKITGISIMRMTAGLDEGPVFVFHAQEILHSDNKNTLEKKLTSLSIKNIEKDLSNIYLDKIVPIKQDVKNISYCKKIDKLSGRINFNQEGADSILRKFKAYYGWPGLYFEWKELKIKIHGIAINKNNTSNTDNKFYFKDNLNFVGSMWDNLNA